MAFAAFPQIPALPGSRWLSSISYGSIEGVTAHNAYFGIAPGKKVKINMVAVNSINVTIGLMEDGYSFDSFYNYGALVGEIVATMAAEENLPAVREILQSFFF